MSGDSLSTLSPAKINLLLELVNRRADGFHDIRSLACGVGLFDRIRLRRLPLNDVELVCDDETLAGPDNLAWRAVSKLQSMTARAKPCQMILEKRIPVGGGMGGGSSDAAASLMLANEWHGLNLSDERLAVIGSELGSDVPLFFHLPSALVEGRGERVTPVTMRWKGWILLVVTGLHVSTKAVYQAVQRGEIAASTPTRLDALLEAGTSADLAPHLRNDLAPAVFRVEPRVSEALDALNELGLGAFHVTGAGSVLFQLFDEEEEAANVSRRIARSGAFAHVMTVAAPIGRQRITHQEF